MRMKKGDFALEGCDNVGEHVQAEGGTAQSRGSMMKTSRMMTVMMLNMTIICMKMFIYLFCNIFLNCTFFTQKINDSCLQFWGGMGFTNDVGISRSYRFLHSSIIVVITLKSSSIST